MKSLKKYGLFFLIGAIGYAAVEIIWRGRTHWSMMIAGGVCLVLFSVVAERMKERSILSKAVICAAVVTAVELIFGVIFNLWLKMNVWDYSNMPLNLFGQICPVFSLLWVGLALAVMPFVEAVNKDYA